MTAEDFKITLHKLTVTYVFLKEVKCLRILRWRDQQVSSSAARLYVLEEELMNKQRIFTVRTM